MNEKCDSTAVGIPIQTYYGVVRKVWRRGVRTQFGFLKNGNHYSLLDHEVVDLPGFVGVAVDVQLKDIERRSGDESCGHSWGGRSNGRCR